MVNCFIPPGTLENKWVPLFRSLCIKNGADLFSANRKWISAIKILAAIEDGHLTIENLLFIRFHHRVDNFSTKN